MLITAEKGMIEGGACVALFFIIGVKTMRQNGAVTEDAQLALPAEIINDFSIVVATVNGTGSQTANLALLRALMKLGIPVNGKNIFPSNIQGAPTWYHIRLSHEGYAARRHTSEILVAFNQATVQQDIAKLPSGGVCIYNGDWRTIPHRDDVVYYAVPVNEFVVKSGLKGKLRDYIANMVYVGVLAQLLKIPLPALEEALLQLFKGKHKVADPNIEMMRAAYAHAEAHVVKADPYGVVQLSSDKETIVITGNEAAALGSIFGGVSFAAWYPITPSTSLIDSLNEYLPRLRRDPESGKATYAVIQAEDELAAIGMVLGAGWAGARAMTATSGPGISLMAEFAGLGYFAEIPAVIWDVQRVGPSTGLPTRTSQGDVMFTYYLGHGDTKNVILFPATVKECFEFGVTSFDLADTLQAPIFVLSDLDLGMNNWVSEPFAYPAGPMSRGKVLSAEEVAKGGFARYRDLDGDGIGYRTLPGNEHLGAAWLARGTGHDEAPNYSEKPEDWVQNMERLDRKFDTARGLVPVPLLQEVEGAEIGIVAYGTTVYAIDEARDLLAEAGIKTSFLRLRALPVNETVKEFIRCYAQVYVIELNHDGQMHKILQTEVPDMAAKMKSLAITDGMPLTAQWVMDQLKEDSHE